uniref:Retinoic acid receptor gamma-like n=1 Tax=Saccoglossus kowalevskii TaxID=10224 RepID=A0ABM0MAK0_SACKO|nr:PREDICTED: retinoic acid receptor gamma-like [Saccoglossus kowalevskii]
MPEHCPKTTAGEARRLLFLVFESPGTPEADKLPDLKKLPKEPCAVCGAPSSGFHFGATTCEGCKGFFRRSVEERNCGDYKCKKSKSCIITKDTRSSCQYCRFQKCLQVKMDKTKIRMGRQPNHVKHMILSKKQTEDGPTSPSNSLGSPQSNYSPSFSETISSVSSPPCTLDHDSTSSPPGADSAFCPIFQQNVTQELYLVKAENSSWTQSPSSPNDFLYDSHCHHQHQYSNSSPSPVSPLDKDSALSYSDTLLQIEDLALVESTPYIEQNSPMLANHMAGFIEEIVDAYKELHTMYNGKPRLKKHIDVVNVSNLWDKLMTSFQNNVHSLLAFTKRIPGFRSLHVDDQIILIQCSICQVSLTVLAEDLMNTGRVYSWSLETKEELQLLKEKFDPFNIFPSRIALTAEEFKAVDLDPTEISLLTALHVVCKDRSKLKDPESVYKIQNQLNEALAIYVAIRDIGTNNNRYKSVVSLLRKLKNMEEKHHSCVMVWRKTMPHLQFPALWTEVHEMVLHNAEDLQPGQTEFQHFNKK